MKTAAPAADPATLDLVLGFFKLNVTDLDRMTQFYESAFGFVVHDTIKVPQAEERMLRLPGQDFTLVLIAWADVSTITIATVDSNLDGNDTNDADATAAHITECGGTIDMGPVTYGDMRVVMARDPEGHEIEIICQTATE